MKNVLKLLILGIISLTNLNAYSQEGHIEEIELTDHTLKRWLDYLEYQCGQDPNCVPLNFDDFPLCEDGPCDTKTPHSITITDFGFSCVYQVEECYTNDDGDCCCIRHKYSLECGH